jgi:hypothetical protein
MRSVQEVPRLRVAPLLWGTFLLLVYIQLGKIQSYQSAAGVSAHDISEDELRFWLAHWFLAWPALTLMALGFVEYAAPGLKRLHGWLQGLTPRRWRLAGLGYALLLVLLAVVGRSYFLLDLPITDDENLVVFGARMLLEGDLSVPILQPDGAFTQNVTYRHEGMVSSFDYPGTLLFHALSMGSGLGSLLYALAAGLTGLAVAGSAQRLLGRSGAAVAAGLWLFSPMTSALSMTEHAQLASRCFLACAIWLYLRLVTGSETPRRDGALIALAGGLGFLTRSAEAACVLLPITIHLAWRLGQDPRLRRAALAAVPIAAAILGFYAWYNFEVTGIWYLPPRYGPERHLAGIPFGSPLYLLGTNLGHNLMILLIMGLGPLGVAAAMAGARRYPPWATLLTGVSLQVGLAMLYDDTGIHIVGPIHFSETMLGLTLLASAGVVRASEFLRERGVSRAIPATVFAAYLVGGLGLLAFVHDLGLQKQAENAMMIVDAVEEADLENAIVLGGSPIRLIFAHPDSRETGSWVYWLPPPDPYFRDEVIFADPETDLAALREQFPDRDLYGMSYHMNDQPVRIQPLDWDGRPVAAADPW